MGHVSHSGPRTMRACQPCRYPGPMRRWRIEAVVPVCRCAGVGRSGGGACSLGGVTGGVPVVPGRGRVLLARAAGPLAGCGGQPLEATMGLHRHTRCPLKWPRNVGIQGRRPGRPQPRNPADTPRDPLGEYGNSGNLRPGRRLTIEATVNLWPARPGRRERPFITGTAAGGTTCSSPARPGRRERLFITGTAAVCAGTAPAAGCGPGRVPDAAALTLLHPRHARRSVRSGYRGRSGRYGRSGQPGRHSETT